MDDRIITSDNSIVRLEHFEGDSTSVLKGIAFETIRSMLMQMGIDPGENLPKEAYIAAFLDEFMSDGEWILKCLPAYSLDLLLDIWEQDERGHDLMEVDRPDLECLYFLRLFGLLHYKKGNALLKEPDVIYIVKDMKDAFYFHLKSRKSQEKIERYDLYETILSGMMYYYGIIPFKDLYVCFLNKAQSIISMDDLITFIRCRSSFWGGYQILEDAMTKDRYFALTDVEHPDMVLLSRQDYSLADYKDVSVDDLAYISDGAGIDNRFEGISVMGTLLIDHMNMDYYRATVYVKNMIILIQNEYSYEELADKTHVLLTGHADLKQDVMNALQLMYNNIPLYCLKGNTRNEYKHLELKKEKDRKKATFKIIHGGSNPGRLQEDEL